MKPRRSENRRGEVRSLCKNRKNEHQKEEKGTAFISVGKKTTAIQTGWNSSRAEVGS